MTQLQRSFYYIRISSFQAGGGGGIIFTERLTSPHPLPPPRKLKNPNKQTHTCNTPRPPQIPPKHILHAQKSLKPQTLQNRTHLQRLKNQITDKKDEKIEYFTFTGWEIWREVLFKAFSYWDYQCCNILSKTAHSDNTRQSWRTGLSMSFGVNFPERQSSKSTHNKSIPPNLYHGTECSWIIKIFWPRPRKGRCWCFYSLVFDLVNSFSKVIQNPLDSRKAWPTSCTENNLIQKVEDTKTDICVF